MIDQAFMEGDKHAALARHFYQIDKKKSEEEAKKALDEYSKVHRKDPSNPQYYYKVGELFMKTGRVQEALEQFDKAIEIKPDSANYHAAKGTALNELGRYQNALEELDKALSLNQKNSNALFQKSIALKNIGKLDEALTSINSAIQYFPRYVGMEPVLAYYYEIKAGVLMSMGSFGEALSVLDEAEKISPVNKKGYDTRRLMRANLLNLNGRYQEALEEYAFLLSLNPQNAFFHYGKAIALENLGYYSLAKVEIENAYQLDPTNQLFRAARDRISLKAP
ncbi:MAG: tetratricopeptide repeat protein [Nitrososphaeria archaeon]